MKARSSSGDHAARLAGRLCSLGAIAIELPAIRTEPTGEALLSLEGVELVCVSSPAAADALRAALAGQGKDLRALAGAVVEAVGAGTAEAVERHGTTADLVSARAVTEGLIEANDPAGLTPGRAVIVQAKGGRPLLADTLFERGVDAPVALLN